MSTSVFSLRTTTTLGNSTNSVFILRVLSTYNVSSLGVYLSFLQNSGVLGLLLLVALLMLWVLPSSGKGTNRALELSN